MLCMIACVNADGCIDGFKAPRTDLQRFEALTVGQTVAMGRKTWDALPPARRPLHHRRNLVLTRDGIERLYSDGIATTTIESVRRRAYGDCWVIGGGEIYAQLIDDCDRLYISHVKAHGGTVKFPPVGMAFTKVAHQRHDDHELVIWQRFGL